MGDQAEGERNGLLGGESRLEGSSEDYDVVQPKGCGASLLCDPRRWAHRYFVLIFMVFLSFGSYFCYDNPAALTETMKADMKLDTSQYMLFYSLYSWPNVFICFVGGFLLDSVFGNCWGTIIFSLIVTVGQVFFALGALVDSVILMYIGRFIFGIGGESLCVAQNAYAVNWFHGRALNMVFGLQLSFSRVGSTVNMNVMQKIYNSLLGRFTGHVNLGITLFIGGLFCVFSLICAFIMGFFDKRAKRILKADTTQAAPEVINLRDVKDFSVHLWILCVICVAYYVAIFPFISLGQIFFINKFGLSTDDASAVNSVVYIISAVASPVFGFCIDRLGMNVFWVGAGTVLTIGCHAAMAFTFINPFVPMVILGLSYSILASALWPMVALVVAKHQLGTAYGIMQAVQNLGLALIAIAAGKIVDTAGYLILEVFFLSCLFVALIAVVLLYLIDTARGGKLNATAWKRKRLAELQALEDEIKVAQ